MSALALPEPISALPPGAPLSGAELVPMVQGPRTFRTTVAQIAAAAGGGGWLNFQAFLGAATDCQAAFTAAVTAALSAGLGLWIPRRPAPYQFLTPNPNNTNYGIDLNGLSNLVIASNGATLQFVGAFGGIAIENLSNFVFDNFIVDCAGSTKPGTHGIRMSGAATGLLRDVVIKDTQGYGVGAEGGSEVNILFDHLQIYRSGFDGCDFKNFNDNNSFVVWRDYYCEHHGQNGTSNAEAGIDIRGNMFRVEGATILLDPTLVNGSTGLRTRITTADQKTGGIRALISNVDIDFGGTPPSPSTTSRGMQIINYGTDVSGVRISNGGGKGIGFETSGDPTDIAGDTGTFDEDLITVRGVLIDGLAYGFYLFGPADFHDCIATGSTTANFSVEAQVATFAYRPSFHSCKSRGVPNGADGFFVNSTVVGSRFIDCEDIPAAGATTAFSWRISQSYRQQVGGLNQVNLTLASANTNLSVNTDGISIYNITTSASRTVTVNSIDALKGRYAYIRLASSGVTLTVHDVNAATIATMNTLGKVICVRDLGTGLGGWVADQ